MLEENREWLWVFLLTVLVIGTVYVNNVYINGAPVGEDSEIVDLQAFCTDGGGFWNECGSACAGKNVEFCTMQCVQQCECGFDDYGCPSGYECYQEDGTDRGVCKKVVG